jgi:hypothetical protein
MMWVRVMHGPQDKIRSVLVLCNIVAPEGHNLAEKLFLMHIKGGLFHDNVFPHGLYQNIIFGAFSWEMSFPSTSTSSDHGKRTLKESSFDSDDEVKAEVLNWRETLTCEH